MSSVERINQLRDERLAELETFRIRGTTGAGVAGSIVLSATEQRKLLVILRKFREWGKRPENGGVRLW
jgi:hypothetical protein